MPNCPEFNRVAYAAAHVVAVAPSDQDHMRDPTIDWDATMAYRHHLWDYGFAVAEAMDTAQRGADLDWPTALELIRRSIAEAETRTGVILAAGAGTDHLDPRMTYSIAEVIAAYEHQMEAIERLGGRLIIMASRALAKSARSADDYIHVYERILAQAREPVILHWLGEAFDPSLLGYWGSNDRNVAAATCLTLMSSYPHKVDGIKISLLDADLEIDMRRKLPVSVRMYTGDDFNFSRLIEGDGSFKSHALLGIFDAIAPIASHALVALAAGDIAEYRKLMAPAEQLSREIFKAPTRHYKTGLVFLSYLNGYQNDFVMLGRSQENRSILHLARVFELADAARLLENPSLAVKRMRGILDCFGRTT